MNKSTFALIAGLLAGTSGLALAQATPPRQPVPNVEQPGQIQTNKLIGTNIKNAQNETIGEIKSVALSADGTVDAVIVGVGGFLGVGEREVAIGWKDVHIGDGGNQVMVDMTKDQLAALPAYQYASAAERGTVFRTNPPSRAVANQTPPAPVAPPLTTTPRPAAPAPGVAQVPPAATPPMRSTTAAATLPNGMVSASKLVGLNVYDTADKSVGEIKDVVLTSKGEVQRAIVSVGGVLGFGAKEVALNWSDIQFRTDGDNLKAVVAMTPDQLKALPEYRNDNGAWVIKN